MRGGKERVVFNLKSITKDSKIKFGKHLSFEGVDNFTN